MAAKLLLAPLSSFSSSNLRIYQNQHHGHRWLPSYRAQQRRKDSIRASLDDPAFSAFCYQTLFTLADTAGYSQASYYTSLGLFVISIPGLWSLIKRSVKSKIVKKTFVREGMKAPNQMASEILSFFTGNNFAVADRGETITYADLSAKNDEWVFI